MWVTVPANIRLTEDIIAEIKNNHGLKLTGRFKNSGKYKKLEIEIPGNNGQFECYSAKDLDCLKEYFDIAPNWKLRGRK